MSSPGSSSKTLREDSEDPRPSSSNNIRRVVNQEPLREQLMKASPLTQQSLNTLDDDIAPAPPHGHDYMPVDPCSHQNSHSQEDSPTRRRSEGVVYGPNQGPQSRPHSLGIIEERLVWGVQQGQSSRQNPSLDLQDRPEQRRQMNRQGGKRSLSQPNLPIKQVHFPTQTRSASWHPDQANQQGESSRQAAHRVSWQPTSSSLPLNIEEEPSGAQALTHELGEIRKGKRPVRGSLEIGPCPPDPQKSSLERSVYCSQCELDRQAALQQPSSEESRNIRSSNAVGHGYIIDKDPWYCVPVSFCSNLGGCIWNNLRHLPCHIWRCMRRCPRMVMRCWNGDSDRWNDGVAELKWWAFVWLPQCCCRSQDDNRMVLRSRSVV